MNITFKDYLFDSAIYSMVNHAVEDPEMLNNEYGIHVVANMIKQVKTTKLNYGEKLLHFFMNFGTIIKNGTSYLINGTEFRKKVDATIKNINTKTAAKTATVATQALSQSDYEKINGRKALLDALKKHPAFENCNTLEEALLKQEQINEITTFSLENKYTLPMLLPLEIGNFSGLKELHLSGLELKVLPEELGKLTNLVELDISNNNLHTLPEGIVKLTKLESLNLRGNALSSIPKGQIKLEGNCIIFLDEAASTAVRDGIRKLFPSPTVIFYS